MFNKVLGIGLESSCDETAVAIVADGRKIVSHAIFSQIKLHQEYFGVVPEIASRAHL
ncbi:MAG TPA: tRNA (adenosine(37)-N6)-threonylcarbamoyltransferase complex transferase subunit TsaD, partial [Spirochaetota bacterium]|nr:tRNA (adenosine(37)-N6)-threonylcarbamoyltransferase complex transferase subunit TsaD [Spirochaetota bacterium]